MARFSRRHYQAIAEVLHTQFEGCQSDLTRGVVLHIADAFCQMFKQDNPCFCAGKFMNAIGQGSGGWQIITEQLLKREAAE